MLTKRSDYLSVGGMDEMHFPVSFNDVDYCLKLREFGKRIVFTTHAKLNHLESASRGRDDQRDRAARFDRELRMLRMRWGNVFMEDPYYNPTLSLDGLPPARALNSRFNRPIKAKAFPEGFSGHRG